MGGYQEIFALPSGIISFICPSHIGGKDYILLLRLRIRSPGILIIITEVPVYIAAQILSFRIFFRQVFSFGDKAVRIQKIGIIKLIIERHACPERRCNPIQVLVINIRNEFIRCHVLHIQSAFHVGIALCQTADEEIRMQVAVVVCAQSVYRKPVFRFRINLFHPD